MYKLTVSAALLWCWLLILPVAGQARQFDLWLGSGMLAGDTTYAIGGAVADSSGHSGQVWFPLSELRWPLDVGLVSLGARGEFGRFSLRGEVFQNATNIPGQMQDSDWGFLHLLYESNPRFQAGSLDVYSTSTASLSALILDLRGRYAWLQQSRFSSAVGLGLRYQRFSFSASDADQYSPSHACYGLREDPFARQISGKVIEYEATYTIPFAEVSSLWRVNQVLSLEAAVGYSTLVKAEDRDDHILRSKLNSGSDTGSAWLVDLKLRCQPTAHWFVTVGVSGLFIDASGTQTQSYYAGEQVGSITTIDQTLTSTQVYSTLEVGYVF